MTDMPDLAGAACVGSDPEKFFIEDDREGLTESFAAWLVGNAKAVCRSCPVQIECLRWALEHKEVGIWGGTTDAERETIRSLTRRRSA